MFISEIRLFMPQSFFTNQQTEIVRVLQTSYKTPQAYGKALKWLSNSLPKSWRKRKAVVVGAAAKLGLTMKGTKVASPVTISQVPKKVKKFYLCKYISYTMPGISKCNKISQSYMELFCKSLGVLKISLVAFFFYHIYIHAT